MLKDRTVPLIFSSFRLPRREGRMSLALSSLGAGPTEQKVFKQSKRQVGLLSRREKFCLLFWNAEQRHPNGLRGFYFSPLRHCARANRH